MRIPNFLKKKIKQQLEISQERKKKKKELPGFMRDQNNFDCTGTNELQLKSKKAFKLNTFKQGFIRLQTTREDSLSGGGIRLIFKVCTEPFLVLGSPEAEPGKVQFQENYLLTCFLGV